MLTSILASLRTDYLAKTAVFFAFLAGGCAVSDADATPPAAATAPTVTTTTPSPSPPATTEPESCVDVAALCVTAGSIDSAAPSSCMMNTHVGAMRAVVPATDGASAKLTFTYRGHSDTDVPLASGEVRRQLGLKLRAQDACNVVYVMWHIEPTPELVVSVKNNPGLSQSAECKALGYVKVAPEQETTQLGVVLTPIAVGVEHVLEAVLEGERLQVKADGVQVWDGALPAAAFTFNGVTGIRSDNIAYDFKLHVSAPSTPSTNGATACPTPASE